jgi:hypothetical protein
MWICPNCDAQNFEKGDCECCGYSGIGLSDRDNIEVFYLGEVSYVCEG